MKLEQLKKFAEDKNLIFHKYGFNNVRNQYIYSKEKDILDQKLIEVKKIPYRRFYYFARTKDMPEHQNYKITAKDYKELLELGAQEEVTK